MKNTKKNKLLIHAWSLQKKDQMYYILFAHWIYLKEIVKYYDEIVLLAPVLVLKNHQETNGKSIACFQNVTVYPLPYNANGYVGAIKHFLFYTKAYQRNEHVTTYYSRYPVPFGWLQKLFGKKSKRIIHYVGDPADAAKNNPNFSWARKWLLINGFRFENFFYNWACKGAKVFTNGHHLAERLAKRNINATPLISSTLTANDFYFKEKSLDACTVRFIYLGYLRASKGVYTVLRAFNSYNQRYTRSSLTIIGSGEYEQELVRIVREENIENVTFCGGIEERELINSYLRNSDIFLFASLSEGSPRVVLEAMANGVVVISTPVGSLPKIFQSGEDILFANFNDSESFVYQVERLIHENDLYTKIRKKAYSKVEGFTLEKFIKTIFNEN